VIFSEDRARAASAVAAALADGISPESVGEALSLAANRLLLHDPGRTPAQASTEKPALSVHGASVGVHAMDSANAWRNIASVCNHRNRIASLIVGAYHTAGQTKSVGPNPLPFAAAADDLRSIDASGLIDELATSVRAGEQLRACATVFELNRKGTSPDRVFAALLPFAVSEDGALHAEKFYRTVREEFNKTRTSQRWNHLIALARVTASEFGIPAPGRDEAQQLLGLTLLAGTNLVESGSCASGQGPLFGLHPFRHYGTARVCSMSADPMQVVATSNAVKHFYETGS
jgi:hypothetical protein